MPGPGMAIRARPHTILSGGRRPPDHLAPSLAPFDVSSGRPEPGRGAGPRAPLRSGGLIRLAALLLARPLPRQRLLGAAAIARLQVEGVLLDILDDIFLLHLPLEPAKRALDGLAILHFHFSQA